MKKYIFATMCLVCVFSFCSAKAQVEEDEVERLDLFKGFSSSSLSGSFTGLTFGAGFNGNPRGFEDPLTACGVSRSFRGGALSEKLPSLGNAFGDFQTFFGSAKVGATWSRSSSLATQYVHTMNGKIAMVDVHLPLKTIAFVPKPGGTAMVATGKRDGSLNASRATAGIRDILGRPSTTRGSTMIYDKGRYVLAIKVDNSNVSIRMADKNLL